MSAPASAAMKSEEIAGIIARRFIEVMNPAVLDLPGRSGER
jgi:hypothetical protein